MSVTGAGGASQIRRHHTISITPNRAASSSRNGVISEEPQEGASGVDWPEDDDDYVQEDWQAPTIGSVGDGSKGLHRQASLPTTYNNREVHRVRSAAHMATRVNSLSAIEAEHVGEGGTEEDDWEKEMPWNRDEGSEAQLASSPEQGRPALTRNHTSSSVSGPMSPTYTPPQNHSPPPPTSGANVRRHQSLTYGPATGGAKLSRNLTATAGGKRGAGPIPNGAGALALGVPPPAPRAPSPSMHEEDDEGSVPSSPVARAIGWGDGRSNTSHQQHASGLPSSEWRGDSQIDEIQRALGALEMQTSSSNASIGGGRGQSGSISRPIGSPSIPGTPPRYVNSPNQSGPTRTAQQQHSSYFPPGPPSAYTSATSAAVRGASGGGNSGYGRRASSPGIAPGSAIGSVDRRDSATNTGGGYANPGGPPSRSNSMPVPAWDNVPLGGGRPRGDSSASGASIGYASVNSGNTANQNNQASNPNSNFSAYSAIYGNSAPSASYDPNVPPMMIPGSPYGGMANMNAGGPMDIYSAYGAYGGLAPQQQTPQQQLQSLATPRAAPVQMTPLAGNAPLSPPTGGPGSLDSPEIRALVAAKGYNPTSIDIHPANARFFVIKSYTEEDVHKSLKYEIWSSTDPGNKRLDKAFRENAGRGPIYLFFSVNTSGHFCGMAEMLTPLDYSRTSTVWAQDKWKGVFKVRWIFIRDIPNAILRGIKLENTQERKPVTNSRDTQELLPDAGSEMMRIFLTHDAKTSLLQDYAYYDTLAMQRTSAPVSPTPDAPGQVHNTGPPQRMIQQRQQQQMQQQVPQNVPGNNTMYQVTPQQYQLLQQTQYALASIRNTQDQLFAQQQMQQQNQQQQQPPSRGPGGQQFMQPPSNGVPQSQQRSYPSRQSSGTGGNF